MSVLPVDDAGQVPLVCHASHGDGYGVLGGYPAPGDGELSELAWFAPEELRGLRLSRFARALLQATRRL